jgi:hypothetical protein
MTPQFKASIRDFAVSLPPGCAGYCMVRVPGRSVHAAGDSGPGVLAVTRPTSPDLSSSLAVSGMPTPLAPWSVPS